MTEITKKIEIKETEQETSVYAGNRKAEFLFDKITTNLFAVVSFGMSMLLTVIICAATILRYCFEIDLFGYEEWIKVFAFWLYFMGAAYGAFEGTHISADLVQSYMKPGLCRRLLLVLRNVITFGISCLFVWYGWNYFKFDLMGPLSDGRFTAKSVLWGIPAWCSSIAIFTGLFFMAWYFGADLLRSLKAAAKGSDEA